MEAQHLVHDERVGIHEGLRGQRVRSSGREVLSLHLIIIIITNDSSSSSTTTTNNNNHNNNADNNDQPACPERWARGAEHPILCAFLDSCASSLRRGHANLLCVVPSLTDDPRRESIATAMRILSLRRDYQADNAMDDPRSSWASVFLLRYGSRTSVCMCVTGRPILCESCCLSKYMFITYRAYREDLSPKLTLGIGSSKTIMKKEREQGNLHEMRPGRKP